jgi:hypothetical protein
MALTARALTSIRGFATSAARRVIPVSFLFHGQLTLFFFNSLMGHAKCGTLFLFYASGFAMIGRFCAELWFKFKHNH